MFVGEAPGLDEDRQGEPFVGKAGQLLTRLINEMGFYRREVYIANILKCRPDTPRGAGGNRRPDREEIVNCLPFLYAQIQIIRPAVIVCLGSVAAEGLIDNGYGVTDLRGHEHDIFGIPIVPTYHPSYVLREDSQWVFDEWREDAERALALIDRRDRV
jgi:uracil-DNA glycosylase